MDFFGLFAIELQTYWRRSPPIGACSKDAALRFRQRSVAEHDIALTPLEFVIRRTVADYLHKLLRGVAFRRYGATLVQVLLRRRFISCAANRRLRHMKRRCNVTMFSGFVGDGFPAGGESA